MPKDHYCPVHRTYHASRETVGRHIDQQEFAKERAGPVKLGYRIHRKKKSRGPYNPFF